MQKIITVTDLQRKFKTILDEVSGRHTPYVVTRGSRPEAALVSYDEYLRFQELQEREVHRLFDRSVERLRRRNRQVSDDQVSRDVDRAVREVRQGGD